MEIDSEETTFFTDYNGDMYYFCSPECKRQFDDHPDHFIRRYAHQGLGI
jgi:YHS domain-containing protein